MNNVPASNYMKENNILIAGVLVAILIVSGAFGYKKFSTTLISDEHLKQTEPRVITVTVGEESTSTTDLALDSGSSWSGEILSSADVNIQPKRDGTIASWSIKIGQRVYQGQVLGRLSAPPRTPDVVQAIASQSESLTRAKAQVEVDIDFTSKKIKQLEGQKALLLTQTNITKPTATLKEDKLRSIVKDSIYKLYPRISLTGSQALNVKSVITIDPSFSATDSLAQYAYLSLIKEIITSIENNNLTIEQGNRYFSKTLTGLSYTVPNDGKFTDASISELKAQILSDKNEYTTAIKELEDYTIEIESLRVSTSDRSLEQEQKLSDIDSQILQLEKDLALSKAEVLAKQASYNSVVGGLTGGLEIIATRTGVISTISKRVGDFVRPEDTLASINGENSNEKLVRFRIPSNGIRPKTGDLLTVTRPGFLNTKVKIKVIGVGVSLDSNGSYMADAQFMNNVDWPVHASVRVIPNILSNQTFIVPFTAIFWSEDGATKVWTVTSEKILKSKEITAGRTFGDTVEITEGLTRGDVVVLQPIAEMKENMLVSIGDNATPQIKATSETKEVQDESKPHSHDE